MVVGMKKTIKNHKNTEISDNNSKIITISEVVILPQVLDIAHAQDFLAQMRALVEAGGDVSLDASGVSRITTPCVQILLSTAKTLEGTGGALRIERASPVLSSAMNDLGVADKLQAWSA
jgi:chemotaxis protein CheX